MFQIFPIVRAFGIIALLAASSCYSSEYLGVSFQSEPWGFIEKGQTKGIICDFYSQLSKQIDTQIECAVFPFYRVLQSLKDGSADFSILYKTAKTSQIATPLVKLTELNNIILSQKGVVIKSYEDLKHISIGTLTKNKFGPPFDNDSNLNKVNVTSYSQIVKMLDMKRIDAVIGSQASLEYNLKLQGLSIDDFGKAWVLNAKEVWFYVSKQSKLKNIKMLKGSLEKMANNNIYQEIIDKAVKKSE